MRSGHSSALRLVPHPYKAAILFCPSGTGIGGVDPGSVRPCLYSLPEADYSWLMSSNSDASEFIDPDFQPGGKGVFTPTTGALNRPPSREEIEAMVSEKQIRLAELKRAQEELERERSGLEEMRRRQAEFQTGRQEMTQHLTRGIGLLEESELNTRRDAEQMARMLADFRDALAKVQAIQDQAWTADNYSMELTKALTVLENARMEWNGARVKLPILSGETATPVMAGSAAPSPDASLATAGFWRLCKIGLALTWPVLLVGLGILARLLLR